MKTKFLLRVLMPILMLGFVLGVLGFKIIGFILLCLFFNGIYGLTRLNIIVPPVKFKRNSILPLKGFESFMFFGLILVRKETQITDELETHVYKHKIQAYHCGYLLYYVLYCFEFVVNCFRYWSLQKAYDNSTFEYSADYYSNDECARYCWLLRYLKRRKK